MSAKPNPKDFVFYPSGQQFPNRRTMWVLVAGVNFPGTSEILIPWAGKGLTCVLTSRPMVPGGHSRPESQGTGRHLWQSRRDEMMGPHQPRPGTRGGEGGTEDDLSTVKTEGFVGTRPAQAALALRVWDQAS